MQALWDCEVRSKHLDTLKMPRLASAKTCKLVILSIAGRIIEAHRTFMLSSLRILSMSISESASVCLVSSQRVEFVPFSLTSRLLSESDWLLMRAAKLVCGVYLRWCKWTPASLEDTASLPRAEDPMAVSADLGEESVPEKLRAESAPHLK